MATREQRKKEKGEDRRNEWWKVGRRKGAGNILCSVVFSSMGLSSVAYGFRFYGLIFYDLLFILPLLNLLLPVVYVAMA